MENVNLPTNNGTPDLSLEELKVRAREIHDLWTDKYYEEKPLRIGLELQALKEYPLRPIEIRKGDLNREERYPISFNPDQTIEVRVEADDTGNPVWSVRNKTISEEQVDQKRPDGQLKQGTVGDVNLFISEVDPQEIGVHKLKSILEDMKDPKGKEVYIYYTKDDTRAGLVSIKKNGDKSAHISILAAHPRFQNKGVGGAILNGLKDIFDDLSVSAAPFGLTPGSTTERLSKFHRENGFVSERWSKKMLSLDDRNNAGQWHRLNESIWSVGNGQHILDNTFVIRAALRAMLDQEKIKTTLSPKFLQDLEKWNRVNTEKNELEKRSDDIHESIREKARAGS